MNLSPTLWKVVSGNKIFASSLLTDGWTITSSPFFQLTGVVILCLSPSWRAITFVNKNDERKVKWLTVNDSARDNQQLYCM